MTEKIEHKMKPHLLTEKQWSQLEDVVKCFDSFEENGLGCTSLKKHSIKLVDGAVPVRDKYCPISPAVQEIVYKEIDLMLELKVIELRVLGIIELM